MKLRSYPWLFLTLLCFFSPEIFAVPNIFTVPQGDASMIFLNAIFGTMGNVLTGTVTQTTPLGVVLSYFNNAILVLGGIVVLYSVVVSTLNTAHDGEMLGKKWNSIWIPVRAAFGFALLLPTKAGYAIIQILVMWFIIQGVGAADYLWKNTIKTLYQNSAYGSQHNPQNIGPNILNAANMIFVSEVCAMALSQSNLCNGTYSAQAYLTNNNKDYIYFFGLSNKKTTIKPDCLKAGIKYICGSSGIRLLGSTQVQTSMKTNLDNLVKNIYSGSGYGSVVTYWQQYKQNGGISPDEVTAVEQNIQQAAATYLASVAYMVNDDHLTNPFNNGNNTAFTGGWMTAGSFFVAMTQLGSANLSFGIVAPTPQPPQFSVFATLWGTPSGDNSNYQQIMTALQVAYNSTCFGSGVSTAAQTTLQYCIPPTLDNLNPGSGSGDSGNQFSGGGATGGGISTTSTTTSGPNIVLQIAPPALNTPVASIVLKPVIEMVNAALLGQWSTLLINGSGIVAPILIPGIILTSGNRGASQNYFKNILESNPLPPLMSWGYNLLTAVSDIFSALLLGIFIFGLFANLCNCFNPVGYAFSTALAILIPFIALIVGGIWLYGSIITYYIPMVPYIIFTLGAIAWLILVIEAMVAAPIMALGILHPEGRHDVFGHSGAGLMILTNVFLRPSLMIVGFWASFMMISIVGQIVNAGFLYAVYNIAISTAGGSKTASGALVGYVTLWGALSFIGIYILMILIAFNKAFSLMYILPDRILRWIGGSPEDSGIAHELQSMKQGYEKQTQDASGAGKGSTAGVRQLAQAKEKNKDEDGGSLNF
jgi:hypothetical protein